MTPFKTITWDGIWKNNPALVQVLGLCPLMAVSSTVTNALGLGLATLFVLTGSNTLASLFRRYALPEIRLPLFVLLIATLTTGVEFIMQALTFDLYTRLGIFIPLIVTNCTVVARADSFASRNPVLPAALDGFMMGFGFLLVLVALGALRELIGYGSLFRDMHLLFGEGARNMTLQLFPASSGALIAILPPGAFIGLGLLMALKNRMDSHFKDKAMKLASPIESGSKRVRTTGKIT